MLAAGCGSATEVGRVPAATGHPLVATTRPATTAAPGPVTARIQKAVTARCPAGTVVVAGGADADLSNGATPNPSLRLVATLPAADQPGVSAGPPAAWQATVATGGVDQADARTTAVALCAPAVRGLRVVTADRPGPSAAASSAAATASCPAGSIVVGGGAAVSLQSGAPGPPQYFVTGSYPSGPTGAFAASDTEATAWTAIGALGGAPMSDGRIRAVAVCAPRSAGVVRVATVTRRGPTTPRTAEEVTATCGPGTRVVGGGMFTGPPERSHTLQGLHLRGTFPSSAGGRLDGGSASPTSWSVVANAGGVITIGARTTAFALCTG